MSKQLDEFWEVVKPLFERGRYLTCQAIIDKLPSLALKKKYEFKASKLLSRLFKETKHLERQSVRSIAFTKRHYYRAQHAYRLKQTPEQLTLL